MDFFYKAFDKLLCRWMVNLIWARGITGLLSAWTKEIDKDRMQHVAVNLQQLGIYSSGSCLVNMTNKHS